MSQTLVSPLQTFVGAIDSIVEANIEQKALLLDISFCLKNIGTSNEYIDQIIHLVDLLQMEECAYHVFKGHDKFECIQNMYIEVHNYV